MACITTDNCATNSFPVPPCGSAETSVCIQLLSTGASGTYRIRVTPANGTAVERQTGDDGGTIKLYMDGAGFLTPAQTAWPSAFFTANQGPYKVEVFDSSDDIVQQDDSVLSTADCVIFEIGQPWDKTSPLITWTFTT